MLTKSSNQSAMKQKIKQSNLKRFAVGLTALVMVIGGLIGGVPIVRASIQDQINELNAKNSNIENKVDKLEDAASSLTDRINKIAAKIASKEAEIQRSEQTISQLEVQIQKKEKELEEQKDLLGQNIRAMYIEGDVSTLEMLASSKDLSEFVDKQQYRNSVQNKISDTLDKIRKLKQELDNEKNEITLLLKDQQKSRSELAEQKSEQDAILSLNSRERSELNTDIRENSKQIASLQAEQVRQNMASFGGGVVPGVSGGGGYPYGNAVCLHPGAADPPCVAYDWGYPNSSSYYRKYWDQWGYGYRNCTSWAAYRVSAVKGYTPAGLSNLGHAKYWPDRTSRPTGFTPKKGAVAVTQGPYGHVRYVESVNGDGSIVVSDYNFGGDGKYRIYPVSAGTASSYEYIYF